MLTSLAPQIAVSRSDTAPDAQVSAIASRIDRLPVTRHLWLQVLLISLGGFFEVYDLIFTGYIAPGLAKSGLLATTTTAFFDFRSIAGFIAVTFGGLFVGTFGLGWLPDRLGRRTVFTYALLCYSFTTAMMAFQTSANGLIFWRFLTGIGVGLEIVVIDTYITELVPRQMRGRAMSFNQTVMFVAAPVAAILAYWLVPTQPLGLDGWRWVVLAGAVGAVLVWFIRLGVPKSPRWLASRGRVAEACRILDRIERTVTRELDVTLPPPQSMPDPVPKPVSSFAELWRSPYRRRVYMMLVFNFCQSIGYYGFASWVPALLVGQGVTTTKSLLYSFVVAIALPVGPLLVMALADRIQRKWLIVASALAMSVFGLLFSQARDASALTIFGVLVSLAGQAISVSYHAYQSELFPTRMRSLAVGLVYSVGRLGAMISGFIMAYLLRDFGPAGVFAAISACMLVVILAIGIFGPRTNHLALEELSN